MGIPMPQVWVTGNNGQVGLKIWMVWIINHSHEVIIFVGARWKMSAHSCVGWSRDGVCCCEEQGGTGGGGVHTNRRVSAISTRYLPYSLEVKASPRLGRSSFEVQCSKIRD